jgi:tetratricopeptide (TPR) repeat protein
VTVVACGALPSRPGGPPPSSPHTEASAAARVTAALLRPTVIPFTRVLLTTSLQSSAPRRIAANPPEPHAIALLCDLSLPERRLVPREIPFDSDALGNALVPCFAPANATTSVVALTLSVPIEASTLGAAPSDQDRCVARRLPDLVWGPHPLRLSARVAATPVFSTRPRESAAILEELGEVARQRAHAVDPELGARLDTLAGALHLELSRGSERDAELDRARESFEQALASNVTALRPAALFGLGVALSATAPPRAIAAYRALVCPERFSPTSPLTLDQDHPDSYWRAWRELHPLPGATAPAEARLGRPGEPQSFDEELVYRSPYAGCQSLAGTERAWVAEAWRAIAQFHELYDFNAEPFRLNRAATAYTKSLSDGADSPFVRLALAHTLYRAQRYHEAARQLARLLTELEGSSSVAARELRLRASQILASALTFEDFEGASESEPAIERPDALSSELNPARLVQRLAVVFERLDDPSLVPPGSSFAPEVVFWSAWELAQMGVGELAARGFALFLKRWPLHADAPIAAWHLAEAQEMVGAGLKLGSPEQASQQRLVTRARADLQRYAAPSPWVTANANDAEALARAREISDAAAEATKP